MYCKNCGAAMGQNTRFCGGCGQQAVGGVMPATAHMSAGRVGYSERITDPAFAGYIKTTNRWSSVMTMILAFAAVIGFYIYGEIGTELENPQALLIGLGLGAMFMKIYAIQYLRSKNSITFDGVVVDKTKKNKERRQNTGENDYVTHNYIEYAVIIRADN